MKWLIGIICGVALQFFYPEFGSEMIELFESASDAVSSL